MADDPKKFAAFANDSKKRRSGLLSEFLGFLMENKKWWLLPIIVAVVLLGLLVVLGGTAAAPFIYPLF